MMRTIEALARRFRGAFAAAVAGGCLARPIGRRATVLLIAATCGALVHAPPALRAQTNAPEPQPLSSTPLPEGFTPGIAIRGAPAGLAGFDHFPYADPRAPKGGRLTLSALGTFDSLNPFIVRGSPAQATRGMVIEPLMARSLDEPFALYPLIARGVRTDASHRFVEFALDPRARFSDGTPVTADDILFSYRLLREKGRPNHRYYYGKVETAEKVAPDIVRFTFSEPDRELPLIMGLLPVFPGHAVDESRFEETTLAPPVGSGPYRVSAVEAGASLTLTRDPNYWGRDLPAARGLYNFDEIRTLWFRDANTELEAFRAGLVDARFETDPGRWQDGYDFPAARNGQVVRETIATGLPKPTSALVFNMRRPLFADVAVRRALIELFDGEWLSRNFYHDLLKRTAGFFEGSDLSSLGRPADAREREILAPFPLAVTPAAMGGRELPPVSDGSGRDRTRLKAALELLDGAGWSLSKGRLISKSTGEPFAFEILVTTRDQERLAIAYASQLKRAGITATVRLVDAVQFDARRNAYEFDMVPYIWSQSLSPGNELSFYFGSEAADQPGTRNYMGARNPAIDAAIAALLAAETPEGAASAARALDRVLISGAYAVPLFHPPGQWLARWTRIGRPPQASLYGTLVETWWRESGR